MTVPPREPSSVRVTVPEIAAMAARGDRIVMLTAYDAPSARLADEAGVDILLVGDSAGTTVLGLESTVGVTMDEMVVFTRAVVRGARRALVVADLPFGAYEISDEQAVASAIRLVREAGAGAVKLEGAGPSLSRARAIAAAGIPVMGHTGLTPQSAALQGGYRAQGRTAAAARRLLDEALALERAGCFAVVLEAVPPQVAAAITERLRVPTIGIGAGPACSGQVLVWHDLLGLLPGRPPKFVKQYAALGDIVRGAVDAWAADVRAGRFPDASHTYGMPDGELERFESQLRDRPTSGVRRGTDGSGA
ncbi:MAG TPA: 3-methyl-2-oxobutanoate hydroxymethyltransferase [Vicinamibacterales bacterium]